MHKVSDLFDLHSLHLLSLHLSYLPAPPAASTPSTSLMSSITSPRTLAEELGTLAKKNSSTDSAADNDLLPVEHAFSS